MGRKGQLEPNPWANFGREGFCRKGQRNIRRGTLEILRTSATLGRRATIPAKETSTALLAVWSEPSAAIIYGCGPALKKVSKAGLATHSRKKKAAEKRSSHSLGHHHLPRPLPPLLVLEAAVVGGVAVNVVGVSSISASSAPSALLGTAGLPWYVEQPRSPTHSPGFPDFWQYSSQQKAMWSQTTISSTKGYGMK